MYNVVYIDPDILIMQVGMQTVYHTLLARGYPLTVMHPYLREVKTSI
jgi:hypothetical protein